MELNISCEVYHVPPLDTYAPGAFGLHLKVSIYMNVKHNYNKRKYTLFNIMRSAH
jgi:hypothetical protein